MKVPQGELLLELAALIERHPSQDWMRLALMIEEEKSRSQIVSFLKGLSTLREALSGRSTTAKIERGVKEKAKPTHVGRLDGIKKLELKLGRAPITDLRELAMKAKLRVSPKDSRNRLIERILRASKLRIPERKDSSFASRRKGNDFGQWARIILGKTHKTQTTK